jgi:hypothetical protein
MPSCRHAVSPSRRYADTPIRRLALSAPIPPSLSERNTEFCVLTSVQRFRLFFLILGIAFVSLLLGAGIGVYRFVQGDACREWLTRRLNHSFRTDGKLESISWNGTTFHSSGYSGTGRPKSRVISLQATDISAHLNLFKLFTGVWDFDEVTIQKVNVNLGKRPAESAEQKTTSGSGISLPHLFTLDFNIDHLLINEGNLHWAAGQNGSGELVGMKVIANRRGQDSWDISASGGKTRHTGLPWIILDSVSAVTSSKGVTITQAKLLGQNGGTISLNGFVSLDEDQTSRVHAEFSALPFNDLYPEKLRLNGVASGNADYAGSIQREDAGAITGSLHIDKLRVDWSAFMGKIGSVMKISSMDDWALDSLDTQVLYRNQHVEFSNLNAKYQDQIRVEGKGAVDSGQINANLSVGLSNTVLNWLPGVQQKVFTEERDGLYWAPMQVTGTTQYPKEDLSKRISAALQETVSKELRGQAKDTIKSFLDLLRH